MTAECDAVNVNANSTGVNNVKSNMARVVNVTSAIECVQAILWRAKRSGYMCEGKVQQAQNEKHPVYGGTGRAYREAAPGRWRVSRECKFFFPEQYRTIIFNYLASYS